MLGFRFNALLKPTIWGGERIVPFKRLNSEVASVGESWEISGVKGHETTVAEGEHKGLTVNELVARLGSGLVGKDNHRRFGNEFPLLIKFIDARSDLSIQVHPDDETARRHGEPRGKNEMWYMLDCSPGAAIRIGLKSEITPEEYKAMVANGTICDAIDRYPVGEGDCFHIPAGRIHSIGAGCFLAEVQQTSDLTYRIFDYNRLDANGRPRELHTEKAAEAIDYSVEHNYRTDYTPAKNRAMELVDCEFFNTAVYDIDEPMLLDYSSLDSFVVLIGLKGEAELASAGDSATLREGETLLLPATTGEVLVSGKLKFLETWV